MSDNGQYFNLEILNRIKKMANSDHVFPLICPSCKIKFYPKKVLIEKMIDRYCASLLPAYNHTFARRIENYESYKINEREEYLKLYGRIDEFVICGLAKIAEISINCTTPKENLCSDCEEKYNGMLKKISIEKLNKLKSKYNLEIQNSTSDKNQLGNLFISRLNYIRKDIISLIECLELSIIKFENNYTYHKNSYNFRNYADEAIDQVSSMREKLIYLIYDFFIENDSVDIHKLNVELLKKEINTNEQLKIIMQDLNKIKGDQNLAKIKGQRNIINHIVDYKFSFSELEWLEVCVGLTKVIDYSDTTLNNIKSYAEQNTIYNKIEKINNLDFFKERESKFAFKNVHLESEYSRNYKNLVLQLNQNIEPIFQRVAREGKIGNYVESSKEEKKVIILHHYLSKLDGINVNIINFQNTQDLQRIERALKLSYSLLDKLTDIINLYYGTKYKMFSDIDLNCNDILINEIKKLNELKSRHFISEFRNVTDHYIRVINIDFEEEESRIYNVLVNSVYEMMNKIFEIIIQFIFMPVY